MKNLYIKILLVLFTITWYSCEDLEEEVYSFYTQENYLKTEKELKTQALGLYDFLPHSFIEDQMFKIVTMPSKYYASRNAGLSSSASIYAEGEAAKSYEYMWEVWYRIIGRANIIIKYADNATGTVSQDVIDQYKAEAYFFRAYCYFNLVRVFGHVPLKINPIETAEFGSLNAGNTDIEVIYDQIISDLNFSKDNLPKLGFEDLPKGRIRAASAAQLLGSVYLTMAGKPLEQTDNYQKAIDILEELTNNESDYGVGLLGNWMDNFDNDNKINSEKLFALGSANVPAYGSVLPFRMIPPGGQTGFAMAGAYQYAVSYDLYQLFEDQDDRKKDGFLFTYNLPNGAPVTYTIGTEAVPRGYGGRNGISHLKYTDGSATSPIIHLNEVFYMRYVESFLILAEAYIEIGNAGKALENLNKVRLRVNATEVTETNQTDLRQIVRDERSRELFHEFSELYDIRRWGTAQENFENHPLRLRWNPSATWDDKFNISPIPLSEISSNAKIDQNNGW
jgi:tetratricopeptide (TPR) repeat protein